MSVKPAILLMAYGSPARLDDMRDFLRDVRGGREPTDALVAEMTERYRQAGGSPLNERTAEQAEAVREALRRRGAERPVHVGMRHGPPRIREAIAAMTREGLREATAIALAPHASDLSTDRYRAQVEEAVAEGAPIRFRFVREWWRQPALNAWWTGQIREGLQRMLRAGGDAPHLLFTAHSLPVRARNAGDAYERQLRDHAALLAEQTGWTDGSFAFQSAGASPEPWLGPSIGEVLRELAARGRRRVLVAPIGFVCDHIEILYDLDIEAQREARALGLEMARTPMPNGASLLADAVADAVREEEARTA
ncbi:MAG: ferrochelatase [Kiritimatiellae bacterium]|nr:ferrochelatase [Kiritimatiellia bacterium]